MKLIVFALACLLAPTLAPTIGLAQDDSAGFTPSEGFQTWVTEIVRDQLPEKYEKSKNWGQQKRVFGGWDVEADGFKIETRRKWTDVNDGTWTRYRVTPINPQKYLAVRVEKIEPIEGNKVRLDLSAVTKVRVFGRLSQWERGLQLASLSAEADALVKASGTVEVALKLDPTKLPPDVTLVPTVTQANVKLVDFEFRRLGKFDGPLVHSLSDDAQEILEAELRERRPKLVESLNKNLAKKQDKLKFSLSELLKSEWGKFAPADLAPAKPATAAAAATKLER
jgi:hypothetical protein